jgi:formylglycine-generating enzyme required for sulfatase activity
MTAQPGKAESLSRSARVIAYAGGIITAACLVFFLVVGAELHSAAIAAGDVLSLSPERESALKPGDVFHECGNCPEMVVVPAGSFMMGSPPSEKNRAATEGPPHRVTIAKPFAVSKFEQTFAQWDACIADGGCEPHEGTDEGWGRGRQPVINVTWSDAKSYVAWLSKTTGKPYRLLTEAEYEYAARAATQTAYPWGDEIGKNNANCNGCGSQWDGNNPAPVGSFAPNRFGLYDMVGNVWEWVEDCLRSDYAGAPDDGSAWIAGDVCDGRVVRGGSWFSTPQNVRSAARSGDAADNRSDVLGFRVGRAISR